jgi:hypothetical protein
MGFDPLSITCLSYNTRQPDEARWGPWTLGVKARTIGLFSWPGHRIYHVISEVIRAMARSAIETVTRPMGQWRNCKCRRSTKTKASVYHQGLVEDGAKPLDSLWWSKPLPVHKFVHGMRERCSAGS